MGGPDTSRNVVCACTSCNHDKGRTEWQEWFQSQYFFSYERESAIKAWTAPEAPVGRYNAYKRRNVCYATV